MIHGIKNFIVDHYLVLCYLVVAILFILGILFKEDLPFLLRMLACLIVITLYAGLGFLGYIVIRALFADHAIDKKSIKICLLLIVILVVLVPILKYFEIPNIGELYLLAPLASWPAFLAIGILNINTKWVDRRNRRKLEKQAKNNAATD